MRFVLLYPRLMIHRRVIMKKIYSLAALAFFAASSLSAQSPDKNREHTAPIQTKRTGQEVLASLREGYQNGTYDAFLANLRADYQTFVKSGKFDEFVQMRDIPLGDEKLLQLSSHFDALHQKLIDERNQELKSVIEQQNDPIIKQRVQSILTPLSDEQRDALHYLASLRFKTPDKGTSDDEKKLIEIDLVSEFNLVHLDSQYAQKPFDDRIEKHVIINMEMMRQMKDAASSFENSQLKKKIEQATSAFDTWQARSWDMRELNNLVKKPGSDFEKKIASILSSYQVKKDDLYQKEFLAKIDKK